MKKITAALLAAFLLVPTLLGAQSNKLVDTQAIRVAFNAEKITVSSTAVGFTAATIHPSTPTNRTVDQRYANMAYCTVATDAIRWLSTGTAPTATDGLLVASGGNFTIYGRENVDNFKMIRVTTDATVNCQYSR